jgi:hypothetical protein
MTFVGLTTIFAQTKEASSNVFDRLGGRFEKRWTIEPIIAGAKTITINYSIHDGVADIFVIDRNDRKILQFLNLMSSGVVEIPRVSISPGDYYVVMVVNSRRIAKQSFIVK